jgi:transketolase
VNAKAQRLVWGETLTALARDDDRILVIDGDLATSTRADIFADAFPAQFIQGGIAEQNMVGMAFGLSTLGSRPWLSSFSVFLTHRVLDQLRMLVSQTKAPIRLAGSYAGLLNGASGTTHQDLVDLAVMRQLPNMTVLAPADAVEAEAIIRWAAEHDGPVYIRLARDPVSNIFGADYTFTPTIPVVLSDGNEALVVSTGVQTVRTSEALGLLAADGRRFRHVHVPMLKPLSTGALVESMGGHRVVITVEEHSIIGGLGSLVMEHLADAGVTATVHRIALSDGWSESAPNDFLLEKYGLSAERVAAQIRAAVPTAALT